MKLQSKSGIVIENVIAKRIQLRAGEQDNTIVIKPNQRFKDFFSIYENEAEQSNGLIMRVDLGLKETRENQNTLARRYF